MALQPQERNAPVNNQSSDLTRYLARLIGMLSIVVCLAILLRAEVMTARLMALVQDGAALMVLDLAALAAAIAWILAHNRWSGGVLSVVVTLVGWAILARALFILVMSQESLLAFVTAIGLPGRAPVYGSLGLAFGVAIAWAGFRAR